MQAARGLVTIGIERNVLPPDSRRVLEEVLEELRAQPELRAAQRIAEWEAWARHLLKDG
jgi:hypothetical protein